MIDDTTRQALSILRSVWGCGSNLSTHDVKFLEAHEAQGETALETCARLAGADVKGIKPFEHGRILQAAASAELRASR